MIFFSSSSFCGNYEFLHKKNVQHVNHIICFHFRRLYPDLSFFQMATAFPCVELADPRSDIESLRCRVARSVIRSQNVAKNRSGMAIADVSWRVWEGGGGSCYVSLCFNCICVMAWQRDLKSEK